MARIIIAEQPRYPFSCQLAVRVTDLNYGDHLGYDRLLGMAHEARMELFEKLGVTEMDIGDGLGVIAADLAVVYQGEAFRGHKLVFDICPTEIARGSFRLAHRVRKHCGAPIALIEIGFVAFDYKRRLPARLPPAFRGALVALGGAGEAP